MSRPDIPPAILEKAQAWLSGNYDKETRDQVREMIDNHPQEVIDAFYQILEFGTGGLRGVMGPGTNRMNKYTVGMATQGLANYLRKSFPNDHPIRVAIAFDSRRNNTFFAQITANVLSANGIRVFLFDDMRPTPELSFAIRHLHCHSGVVITASHNPPEYNGYKAYWNDGAQLISPHDKNVIAEVSKIRSVDEVKFEGDPALIEKVGKDIDREYLKRIQGLSLAPDVIRKNKGLGIVYTPLHGTGIRLVPEALRLFGFTNVIHVAEQDKPDGSFPTVKSPNPEEPEALEMALMKAKETGAAIVLASDPDADRVGVAVRNGKGDYILLNGNQPASLLFHYILSQLKAQGRLKGREFVIKTVVTSEILKDIADKAGVECFDVLTGFKYIAEIIRKLEGKKQFILGGEESYGTMIGDFVRDKDAVSSCCLVAEAAAWAAGRDQTLYDYLQDIYLEYGFYKERLLNIVRKGKQGAEEIAAMMEQYRSHPPVEINNSPVVKIKDYLTQKETDLVARRETNIDLPMSNVLQFFLADGSKISVRPSGTEPKIKYYFSTRVEFGDKKLFEHYNSLLDNRIGAIIASMQLK